MTTVIVPAQPASAPAPDVTGLPAQPAPEPASDAAGTASQRMLAEPAQTPQEPAQAGSSAAGKPWDGVPAPAGYALDSEGVALESNDSRIAGPVWVAASTVDERSGIHGLVIRWLDVHGQLREWTATRDELVGRSSALPQRLAAGGLSLMPGSEMNLLKYLAAFDVPKLPQFRSVAQLGWVEEPGGGLAYMLPAPTGLIAGRAGRPVIFQPERESPSVGNVYEQGTLQDWQRHVLEPCRKNPLLLFAVLVALSGPMLRFAQLESGGFHYYGRSSHGKTTAAQVSASVWGNGADPAESPDRALIQKWNSTGNAFEALLSAHNDGLLVLDEIHTCGAKDFGGVIYNMASGRGKQAMTRERQLRQARQWRAMYFSTGEVSVLSKLEADGSHAHAGQLLRLVDIPIEDGVVIDTASIDPAAFVDRIKRACGRSFGTAGPAFIRALVAEYETALQLVGTVKSMLEDAVADLAPQDAPAEQKRAIKRFALAGVTGVLAVRLGVLTCTVSEVDSAVRMALQSWRADGANVPDRVRGVMNVAQFISRHASRFQTLNEYGSSAPRDRAGFVGRDQATGERAYLFTPEGFREACGGQDPRGTARELHRLGFITAREAGRFNVKRDIDGMRQRVYVVKATISEFDPIAESSSDSGATGAIGAASIAVGT